MAARIFLPVLDELPAITVPVWYGGTGRCRTPSGSCGPHTWRRARLEMREIRHRTWFERWCRSVCPFCNRHHLHNNFLILTWSGNLWLLTDWCPHPRQGRVPMNLHFVLKDQDLVGIFGNGFFSTCAASLRPSRRLVRRACLASCVSAAEKKIPVHGQSAPVDLC